MGVPVILHGKGADKPLKTDRAEVERAILTLPDVMMRETFRIVSLKSYGCCQSSMIKSRCHVKAPGLDQPGTESTEGYHWGPEIQTIPDQGRILSLNSDETWFNHGQRKLASCSATEILLAPNDDNVASRCWVPIQVIPPP